MKSLRKVLICLIIILTLSTNGYSSYAKDRLNDSKSSMEKNGYYYNGIIGENDEGPHENELFEMQEWWYFNGYFNNPNSELKNYYLAISFSSFPKIKTMKYILHSFEEENYGSIYKIDNDRVEIKRPNIELVYNNSHAKGKYPQWIIKCNNSHLDSKNNFFCSNLTFKANSKPRWIMKNTGGNKSTSLWGYYYVMNCSVIGSIKINSTKYAVEGIAYHDHTWAPLGLKKSENKHIYHNITMDNKKDHDTFNLYDIWDWFLIRLKNGCSIYIGKLYSDRTPIKTRLSPSCCLITKDGQTMHQALIYSYEIINSTDSTLDYIKIPTSIHIKLFLLKNSLFQPYIGPMFLDLTYQTKNIKECLFGNKPKWGQWESTGEITVLIKGFGIKKEIPGWGICEVTNNLQ